MSETHPFDLTLDDNGDEEENGEEGDGGEGGDREMDGGEGGGGEEDGGERNVGDGGSECDSNAHSDGEQVLHHEKTTDIRFTLLQWVCILFVKLQLRFGLTNAAATAILAFVSLLLGLITHPLHSIFPKNLPGVKRIASLDNFTEKHCQVFIVCPNDSCNSLYLLEDVSRGGSSMRCSSKMFGKDYGRQLCYQKHLAFGRSKWAPFKTFIFIPPSAWLKKMFQNKQFLGFLDGHLERHTQGGVLEDIWDGRIWNEFMSDPTDHTRPFLNNKNNLGLLINVDWFKPFKRSEYKVAALMLTVLNLPRQERFHKKWTMIVGLIPGPSEPKLHINTFLKPLVDDLLCLWKGLPLLKDGSMVRAALLGVAADMPAARKVSQFLGHKADLGCNRCYFKAEREPGITGASGRMSYYTPTPSAGRTVMEVNSQAKKYREAKSKAEADRIQKQYGLRWSELTRLPYFDLSRMITIDPMHTFLLEMVKDACENHISDELVYKSSCTARAQTQ